MGEERQRLDKWIWFARFARTRTSAQALVAGGRIRVEGRRVTASGHGLKRGDVLTIAAPHVTAIVKVLDFAVKRGGAAQARALYEVIEGADQLPRLLDAGEVSV
jgi:ribosome-associated heat shock protein Hsp15